MRVASAILALLFLASCAVAPVGEPRAVARIGDPPLDGKDYLLSEADFREILRVARTSLAKETPWYSGIQRVHVISATEVELFVGGYDSDNNDVARMSVYRKDGLWRTDGAAPILYVT